MPAPDEFSAVDVVDDIEPPISRVRHLPGIIAVAAAVLFTVQIAVLSDTGDPSPIDVAEAFVEAFNAGDGVGVDELLADEPSFLSWPAGPPWGGGLQWTIELVLAGDDARLSHAAKLDDYLGFHRELDGELRLEFCVELPRTRALDERTWVSCRFDVANELSRVLDPESPSAAGVVRFGVESGLVEAIVVEDVFDPAPSGIPFLLWVKRTHRSVFDELLAGRITVPDYRASTGRVLLEFARDFEAESG